MKNSIIIRAYNAQATIIRALTSALNQDFSPTGFEVIVVNDGSLDGTSEILSSFVNASCLRIITQEHRGAIAAANIGFAKARGDYVVLLDDDDYFEPNLLKELSFLLDQHLECAFAYSDYYEEAENTKKVFRPQHIFETLAAGIMFRKSKLEKEGFYEAGVFFAEYDLLLRTMNKWKSVYYPKPLFTYSRRMESMTGDPEKVQQGIAHLHTLHPDKFNYIAKIRPF